MMKVEVAPSSSSFSDDDENNLKNLLEAFGSAVSLEDIASAYCETGRNLDLTVEMLCNMQASIISESTYAASSGSSSNNILEEKGNVVQLNSKKCSASIGTVSNVIGKDYFNPRPQSKSLDEKLKPVKLNSNDFPVTEIWGEEEASGFTTQGQSMDSDLGELLYKMLGKGFQLEMGVIQQVIGQCGYNMPMSIDKLLDISAATLEKSDDVIGIATGNNMKNSHDVGSTSSPKQSQFLNYSARSKSDAGSEDESILPQIEMKRKDTQREVLEELFSAPDGVQDHNKPTRPLRPVRTHKQSAYGRIVAKPMEETTIEDFNFITRQPINDRNNEANEENYDELRKAVLENWVTMKEYYKASVDAFLKGDSETSQNLLEQGDFYRMKAKEADEKSIQYLTGNSNEDEEFCINVYHLGPTDALRLTRLHLTSFCGFPSVHFMKVVVGTTGNKRDERRKRLITELLEGEGIPWTEEGNGWTISVRVDEIDPIKLSFANK